MKSKGVDIVAVIASNDAWVMNAWGKVNKVTGDDILFLSDTKSFFSKNHAWQAGMGDRNGRWAMVIDKDGTIQYAEHETSPGQVTVRSNFLEWRQDHADEYRSLAPKLFLGNYEQVGDCKGRI